MAIPILGHVWRWLTCYREKERVDVTVSFDPSTYRQSGGLKVRAERRVVEDLSRDRFSDMDWRVGKLHFLTAFLILMFGPGWMILSHIAATDHIGTCGWACGIICLVLCSLPVAVLVQLTIWTDFISLGERLQRRVLHGRQVEEKEFEQALPRFKIFTSAQVGSDDGVTETVSATFPLRTLFLALENGGPDVISLSFRILSELKDELVNRRLGKKFEKLSGDDLATAVNEFGSVAGQWVDDSLMSVMAHSQVATEMRLASDALGQRLRQGLAEHDHVIQELRRYLPLVSDQPRAEMVRFLRSIGAQQAILDSL